MLRVKMDMWVLITVGLSSCVRVSAVTPIVDSCPKYFMENTLLTCECQTGCSTTYEISWVGFASESTFLRIENVRREDDGKQFVCELRCGGVLTTTVYTLRVAYGPRHMSISGISPFFADGKSRLKLTCLATDVAPNVTYFWTDPLCQNNSQGNTCSFVPQPSDDGKTVTCWSYNIADVTRQAHKSLTLNIKYPCDLSPCKNNGTCVPNSTETEGFYCAWIDPCTSSPCQNNGTCVFSDTKPPVFKCQCLPGLHTQTCIAVPESAPTVNRGQIAGGIIGGILLLALAAGVVIFLKRKQSMQTNTTRERPEASAVDTNITTRGPGLPPIRPSSAMRDPGQVGEETVSATSADNSATGSSESR